MNAVAACILCCLAILAARPATGAATLSIRGGPDASSLDATVSDGPADIAGAGAHDLPKSRVYVVTGAALQQSALRGTISGLDIGQVHTISIGWATVQPDRATPIPIAFWGLAFDTQSFLVGPTGPAGEIFTPWVQQRFSPKPAGRAGTLPVVGAVPADNQQEYVPEPAPVPDDMIITWSGDPLAGFEHTTLLFMATILAFCGVIAWLAHRVVQHKAVEAQAALARRMSRPDDARASGTMEELAPDWS